MPKFKAATAVDPFEYDFKPYADAQGVIPEPTDDTVTSFYHRLGTALEDALGEDRMEDVDKSDPLALRRFMANLSEPDLKAMQETMLELHAFVCGGSPDIDALRALPFRLKQAFYGALQEWLSPEGSRLAGSN